MGTETKEEPVEFDSQRSETHGIDTPCGKLYLTAVYKLSDNNKIDYFRIDSEATRFNECGGSIFYIFADCLTFMVRRAINEYAIEAIIKIFSSHRCNKMVVGKPLSCGDAIGKLLRKILIYEKKEKE